jgi:hypothetical protein
VRPPKGIQPRRPSTDDRLITNIARRAAGDPAYRGRDGRTGRRPPLPGSRAGAKSRSIVPVTVRPPSCFLVLRIPGFRMPTARWLGVSSST